MKNKKSEIWNNVIISVLCLFGLYMGSYDLLYSIKEFLFLEDGQRLLSYGWALAFMNSLFLVMMTLGYFANLLFKSKGKDNEKQDNGTQTSTKP